MLSICIISETQHNFHHLAALFCANRHFLYALIFYDAQSRPTMVEYNAEKYHYPHTLQGDIVGIIDSNGTKVVEYKYDAWGNW